MHGFRWNHWNLGHIAEHGVDPTEVESVVRSAHRPFPRRIGEGKYLVMGQGRGGRHLHVIFVLDQNGTVFVIHARPLKEAEKRRYRRWLHP